MLTLTRCGIYFLVTVTLFLLLQAAVVDMRVIKEESYFEAEISPQNNEIRPQRSIGVRKSKPGFFWTLGSSIFQQWNETRSAVQQIRNLLNDQFIDERKAAKAKLTTTTTAEPDATTTTEPYRITRREFNKILMRNLRGLVRLYNLELADALKQSHLTRADFNKQLRVSIKKQLS